MNITFLIGNGFDSSLGIKSSYKEFYEWYCSQPSLSLNIKNFKQHIKELKGEYWSDFEVGLGKYTEYFSKQTVNDFFECYSDAQQSLISYLKIEKEAISINNYDEKDFKNFAQNLVHFFDELHTTEKDTLKSLFESEKINGMKANFISFNYTDTIDMFVSKIAKAPLETWKTRDGVRSFSVNPNLIHVHGSMLQYPLLGVDNESQIANKELLDVPNFKEILIKSSSVDAIGENWHKDAEKIIDNSKIICVFGMSLGDTDAKWWSKITKWLESNSSRHLMIYWYDKNPPSALSVLEYLKSKNEVKEKLSKYVDISKIQNRIHIIFNTKKVLSLPIKKSYDLYVEIPQVEEIALASSD